MVQSIGDRRPLGRLLMWRLVERGEGEGRRGGGERA